MLSTRKYGNYVTIHFYPNKYFSNVEFYWVLQGPTFNELSKTLMANGSPNNYRACIKSHTSSYVYVFHPLYVYS